MNQDKELWYWNTKQKLSIKLDPDELIENKKIGEGTFGIVYKGLFRGNTVAIKKMKEASDTTESIEEFNKEVTMLDKFRCSYIIHFYGAVFIPNKICIVTEFATYGSLNDLIKQHEIINEQIRIKILIDSAKGIQYLHNNGILHRDIKPDNILIFDIEHNTNEIINSKLTDFGSSRNTNMMMTNMTFTKGIGTPIYMSPEILNQEHYKKPSDIYSFSITIYECIQWGKAYSWDQFKFPWKIAEFVISSERLPKPKEMRDDIYSLISECWVHETHKRLKIDKVVIKL